MTFVSTLSKHFLVATSLCSLAVGCSNEPAPRRPVGVDDACNATISHRYTFTSGGFAEASLGSDGAVHWEPAGYALPEAIPLGASGGDDASCSPLRDFLRDVSPELGPIGSGPVLLAMWTLEAPIPSQSVESLDPDVLPAPITRLDAEVRFRLVEPITREEAQQLDSFYVQLDDGEQRFGRILEDVVTTGELQCDRGFSVSTFWVSSFEAPPPELADICRQDGDRTECLSYTLERDGDGCLFELDPAAFPVGEGRVIQARLGGELRTDDFGTLEVHYTAIDLL